MIFRLEQNDFPICFKRKTTNLEKRGKTPSKRPQNTAFYSLFFPESDMQTGAVFADFQPIETQKKADKRPLFPTCILSDSSFRISHYRKSNPTLRRSARYTVRQFVPAPPETSRRKAGGPSSAEGVCIRHFHTTALAQQILRLTELAVVRTDKHGYAIHRSLGHVMDAYTETAAHVGHLAVTIDRRKQTVTVDNQAIGTGGTFFRDTGSNAQTDGATFPLSPSNGLH